MTLDLWKHRGFLTTAGHSISHQKQVIELMEACTLPAAGAVIKVMVIGGKVILGCRHCCQGAAKPTEKLGSVSFSTGVGAQN